MPYASRCNFCGKPSFLKRIRGQFGKFACMSCWEKDQKKQGIVCEKCGAAMQRVFWLRKKLCWRCR